MGALLRLREGFTLLEMLVVIAIVGVLAAFVLPEMASRTEDAEAPRLASDLKNTAHAILLFRTDTRNVFPGDLEDLSYRVSVSADRTVEGAKYLQGHHDRWDGVYLKGIKPETGVATIGSPAIRSGYESRILSPLLLWSKSSGNSANLSTPPTTCANGVYVTVQIAGLSRDEFAAVDELLDGGISGPAESEGFLRFVSQPGASTGDTYYLAVSCR